MKLLIYLIFITLMGFSSNNLSAETKTILWFDYDYNNQTSNKMENAVENNVENEQNNYQIYPNPNNGHFTLYFGDEMEKNIQIFNTQGLKVFETITDKTEIQINQVFSSGIYFVKVSSTHSTNQFKLIIHD